jgi:hypothetical protein
LTLTIFNGTTTTYRVIPNHTPDVRSFRLKKQDGETYDCARTPHGLECTCGDWVYSRDGKDPHGCKHLRALVAHGLL